MVYNFTFPASRDHLWSKRYCGDARQVGLSPDHFNGISISDHVLRRAAKLAQNTQGVDCFLLGTVHTSKDKIFINVDRLDPGKEVINESRIVKTPTSLIPGDLIVSTQVIFEEDDLPFSHSDYTKTFKELQSRISSQSPLCDLLAIKCIICVMPDEDLGTPLKVVCELIHPDEQLTLTPIPPLPLTTTPVTKALATDLAGASKHGYISLDQSRRGVLFLHTDKASSTNPLVGVWASLPLSHSTSDMGPVVWHLLTKYLHNRTIEKVPAPPGPFLLCLLSGGTVDTWECQRAQSFTFKQLRCSRYVVVPDDQFTDTSTFPLSSVENGDSYNIFNKAVSECQCGTEDTEVQGEEDMMPRDAPLATPTQAPKSVPHTPSLQPSRPISPLSILVPSHVLSSPPTHPDNQRLHSTDPSQRRHPSIPESYRNGHTSDHNATDHPVFSPPQMLSPTSHPGMVHHPGYIYPPPPEHEESLYPSQPFFYNPYNPYGMMDPRYQYHYPYPYQMYSNTGHNTRVPVPPVYPPGVSPPIWKKKSSKESSAFRTVNGRTSPNKRSNHRSPEKCNSVNKSVCSTSTVSSRDSSGPKSRKKHSKRSTPHYDDEKYSKRSTPRYDDECKRSTPRYDDETVTTPRSMKSSASSCTSDKKKIRCTRVDVTPASRSTGSRTNSRTTSSQSERSSASISAKALKMLTLQKRQLDHLQQQVAVLMKSTHSIKPESTVTDLDRSIETIREQMEALEQEIDQGSTKTSEMCVGTGKSLIMTQSTGTSICIKEEEDIKEEKSVQFTEEEVEVDLEEESGSNSSTGTRSFYVNFKENCEPQSYNNSDQYMTKFSETTYKDYSIYQHPKIATPSVEHYDSKIFDCENSYIEESKASPEKENFSMASKKYLEKHQLISPMKSLQQKNKSKKGKRREDETRLLYKNGKIIQTIDSIDDSMLQTLQLT